MLARGAPRLRLGAPLARIQSDLLGTVVYTDFVSGRRDVCSILLPGNAHLSEASINVASCLQSDAHRFMMPTDRFIPQYYLFARTVVETSSLELRPKSKLFDSHCHLDLINRRLGTSYSLQEMVTRDLQVEVAYVLPVFYLSF